MSALLLKLFPLLLVFSGPCEALTESELVAFGRNHGDQSLPKDVEDVSSQEVELDVSVKFFGREYSSIFVNENGLVSFLTEIPVFFNLQFPMEYPLIAALYSDVDTRHPNGGNVWYRKTHERGVMDRIGETISTKFGNPFLPREVFVATWDHVGSFDLQSDDLNTFQILIASDERDSFVLLQYPENGIQWIKGKGKTQGVPDAKAQVGIISGEGQYVELPFSGMDQVRHLTDWSNVNEPGVFIYKTGHLEPSEPAVRPNELEYNRYSPNNFRTCSEGGSSTCHLYAQCNDFGPTYCCECNPSYVGNGQTCIQLGIPVRVIGSVSLNVNSVDLRDQVLHCYIVTEEGRSYTAFSRIDSSIGYDLQSLSVIGTPAGWLFAQSVNGAPNGFTFTGGFFNYTAKITFPNTNQEVNIKFVFKGLDVFDYINADVHVEGSLPKLGPKGVKVNIEDFDEKFTKERPGLFSSTSTRKIIIEDGSRQSIPMNVEQRISFEECDGNSRMREIKLHSGRNFVVFDEEEGIVRFALTNKVSPFEDQGDSACMDIDCGDNGNCEVQGSIAVCVCHPGYELHDNQCIDIDECLREGMSNCSPFAQCVNDPGSYGCLCKPGYLGNGERCFPETTCDELVCDPNAECTENEFGIPSCFCLNGFNGNGSFCYSVPSEVELRGYASPETIALNMQDGSRDINVLEDLGPPVTHFYEVLNHGPYSIGDLKLRITWPLKDLNDRYILYIPSAPFIKYSNQGDDFVEECQVDSSIINPEGYESVKRVKRQSGNYEDYNNLEKSINLDDYEKDYAELEDYDYSHFDRYNKDPYILNPSNDGGFPDYGGTEYSQYNYPENERTNYDYPHNPEDPRYSHENIHHESRSEASHPFDSSHHSEQNMDPSYDPRHDPRYTYDTAQGQHYQDPYQQIDDSHVENEHNYDPRYHNYDQDVHPQDPRYDQSRYDNTHQTEQDPRSGPIDSQRSHHPEERSQNPDGTQDQYMNKPKEDPRHRYDESRDRNMPQSEHNPMYSNYPTDDRNMVNQRQDQRYYEERTDDPSHGQDQRYREPQPQQPEYPTAREEQDARHGYEESRDRNMPQSGHYPNYPTDDRNMVNQRQDQRYYEERPDDSSRGQDQRYREHQPQQGYDHSQNPNAREEQDPRHRYEETYDGNMPQSGHDPRYPNYPTDDRNIVHQREDNVYYEEQVDSQDQSEHQPQHGHQQNNDRESQHYQTNDPRYNIQNPEYHTQEDDRPRRQGGPGQVSFICNINLAVNEIASLTVKSHLSLKTLTNHYPSVTQFVFPSEGEVIQSDSVKSKGRNIVNLLTTGVPRDPIDPEYSICGELQCHTEADCYQTFRGDEAAQCRCKPGFKGDGFRCIEAGQSDCRIDPEICHDFGRCEYDTDNEFYRCNCLHGYEGNGTHCEKVKGSCHVLNDCSPYANCEVEGSDFVCRCMKGYNGDGYDCEKVKEESWIEKSTEEPSQQVPSEVPTCVFETCSCYYGYIFEGSRCIVDELRRGFRVPIAYGYCYGDTCECPRGYKYDKYDEICKLEEINFPSSDVFCDDNGAQCSSNAQCIYDRPYDHSLCVCNEGYIGDGFECDIASVTVHPGKCMKDSECPLEMKCVIVVEEFNYKYTCVDISSHEGPDKYKIPTTPGPETEDTTQEMANPNLCSSHLDCHAQADCLFNAEYQRYQCECFQFYEGDGQYECFPSADAGCDILENCDSKNGICSYEDDKFVCKCKAGYQGDGITCREDVIGCNVINNCGEFATCQFDLEQGGYRCKCDEHRGFMGDGFNCSVTSSCREIPSICHEHARCIKNTYNDEHHCECANSFIGDGLHCEAIPEHDGNFLFLAHGMAVLKVPFSSSQSAPALPTFINAKEMATGIDIDCISGKVYWTDTVGKRIRRSNYDGSDVETFLEGDMDFPVGIAIDFKSRNLYWTDSGKRTINIVNIDTKSRRVLVEEFLKNPRGIAIHPTLGALLWTDWDRKHPKIEFSNTDGTGRRTLVDTNLGMPNSISINYEEYKFCWTDGGSTFPPVNPKIECLGIHGGGSREEIITLSNEVDLPYGISINKDQIYWTDWKKPNIHTVNSKNHSTGMPLYHVLAGMGNPFGIVSVPQGCPYATTTCKPGLCEENKICAPNGRGGFSCLCQDGDSSQGCNVNSLY